MVTRLDQFDAAHQRSRHLEAEQAVLGGCFLRPEMVGWLDLYPAEFFDPRHQAVWRVMQDLHRDGVAVDEVTVASGLKERGVEAISLAYVSQLGLICPSEDSTEHYARIVHEQAVNRRVLEMAASIPARLCPEISGETLLADVQRSLSEIETGRGGDSVDVSEAVRDECEAIKRFVDAGGKYVGVPTGLATLDEKIGGLIVGAPTLLGARPGEGKSTMALNVANNASSLGFGVHLFTYEDRRNTFAQRQLSYLSGVPVDRIRARTFQRGDLGLLDVAREELLKPRGIELEHAHGMNASTLVRRVRAKRRAIKTRLVIVDYVQLMPAPDRRMKRYEAIGANMNALVELAGKDDLAVLVLSQLGRDGVRENRQPRMEDFRESGDLEQSAKLILALHSKSRESPTVEVHVLKNHQGEAAVFDVHYSRATCRMR